MPAVFQCPALAAKCDCEARGDGRPGQGWAREILGLEGEKLRMDRREGMRGLLGSPSGICVGPPAPPGSWVADWAWGEQERRSLSHGKSTELGCRGSVMPGPSLAPGPCWESSALITSSQRRYGPDRERGCRWVPWSCGHHQTLQLFIPGAGARPLWLLSQSGRDLSLFLCLGHCCAENCPEAPGLY